MTFPGADTMKAGIMGLDCFLSKAFRDFLEPFIPVWDTSSVIAFGGVSGRVGIYTVGEGHGLVSDGVSSAQEVVLEPDGEYLTLTAFPPNDLRLEVLVIAPPASSA